MVRIVALARALSQDIGDLSGVEQQQVARDASQLPGESELLQSEGGLVPAEDHEAQRAGAVVQEVAEDVVHRRRIHRLVVVVEDDVLRVGDGVIAFRTESGRQRLGWHVEHRPRFQFTEQVLAEAGVQPLHGTCHRRDEDEGVAIENVELVPHRRVTASVECRGGRGRLAVARRRAHDGEPVLQGVREDLSRVGTKARPVKARPEVLGLDREPSCPLDLHTPPVTPMLRQGRLL